ncbi:uncharacterized protein [Equus przewalskii]|uniref:Uncharacterized protein n=1 Tax=Equus przewalskii TaxID=9798 RepID=A0ABM4MNC4_EQUPR
MPAAARLPPRRPALLGLQILTSSSDRRRARLWEGSGVTGTRDADGAAWDLGAPWWSLARPKAAEGPRPRCHKEDVVILGGRAAGVQHADRLRRGFSRRPSCHSSLVLSLSFLRLYFIHLNGAPCLHHRHHHHHHLAEQQWSGSRSDLPGPRVGFPAPSFQRRVLSLATLPLQPGSPRRTSGSGAAVAGRCGVYLQLKQGRGHRQTEDKRTQRRRPCEDGGREWSDAPASPGRPRATDAGGGWEGLSPGGPGGSTALPTPRVWTSSLRNGEGGSGDLAKLLWEDSNCMHSSVSLQGPGKEHAQPNASTKPFSLPSESRPAFTPSPTLNM